MAASRPTPAAPAGRASRCRSQRLGTGRGFAGTIRPVVSSSETRAPGAGGGSAGPTRGRCAASTTASRGRPLAPLAWPIGWPRTRAGDRERSRFRNARAVRPAPDERRHEPPDSRVPPAGRSQRDHDPAVQRRRGVRWLVRRFRAGAAVRWSSVQRLRIRPQFLRPPRPAACRSSSVPLATPRTPRQLVIVAVRLVGSTAGRRLSERALAQGHAGPPVPPIGGSRTVRPRPLRTAACRSRRAAGGDQGIERRRTALAVLRRRGRKSAQTHVLADALLMLRDRLLPAGAGLNPLRVGAQLQGRTSGSSAERIALPQPAVRR